MKISNISMYSSSNLGPGRVHSPSLKKLRHCPNILKPGDVEHGSFPTQKPVGVVVMERGTLLKFNIAPENIPSQKESSLPTIIFQGLC